MRQMIRIKHNDVNDENDPKENYDILKILNTVTTREIECHFLTEKNLHLTQEFCAKMIRL